MDLPIFQSHLHGTGRLVIPSPPDKNYVFQMEGNSDKLFIAKSFDTHMVKNFRPMSDCKGDKAIFGQFELADDI